MSADQWYLEALQNYLNASEWRDSIQIFVRSNNRFFINIHEYHPQQYVIWKLFQEIAESLLNNALMTIGGSLDTLEEALDSVKHKPSRGPRDEVTKEVIDKLLAFESFPTFATMMNNSCIEDLQDEGVRDLSDTDENMLMRMGFTVADINTAYDDIGRKSGLEDMIMFLSARVAERPEPEVQSFSKKQTNSIKSQKEPTASSTYSTKSTKQNTPAPKSSSTFGKEDYNEDYVPPYQLKYSTPIEKFITECRDYYNLKVDVNELNAKFVIAESVLSNYQNSVLDSSSASQLPSSDLKSQDQLLALTRWASEMRSLQSDLFIAYNEDILCNDLTFNHPKGLIEWYSELETLRHAINDSYQSNQSNQGASSDNNPLLISDNELHRMAELDRIAAMGTENEQKLHYLLSQHETIRKNIYKLYQKCNILINTNKSISRNLIEEVYLVLKEKVKGGNTHHQQQQQQYRFNDGTEFKAHEETDEEYDIWNDPLIQQIISYDHGMDLIHYLLELHLLEDEQTIVKYEINQMIGIENPNPSDAKGANTTNQSDLFQDSKGGGGGSASNNEELGHHLDGMFNFDEKMLSEIEDGHSNNQPNDYPADSKDAKGFTDNFAKGMEQVAAATAADYKQSILTASDSKGIDDAKPSSLSSLSDLPPLLSPNKNVINPAINNNNNDNQNNKKNTDNKGQELLDSLKNGHRQALNNLKESLEFIKQQKLSNLENRLLMKKKLLTTAKNQPTRTDEDIFFIENEEKEIIELENSLYNYQNRLSLMENAIMDGYKFRCIHELKKGKQILNNNTDDEDQDSIKDMKVLLEKIHHSHENGGANNNDSEIKKNILEKYEKEKEYLLNSLQQQKLKQFNKLQKRLAARHKDAKANGEDINDIDDIEINQIRDDLQKLDQQYSNELQSSITNLQNNLLLTLAGSEMNEKLLIDSILTQKKHLNKDEDADDDEDDPNKGLLDDYLLTDKEKLMKENFPIINYIQSLDKVKDKYLLASNQLYQSLYEKKLAANYSLQQRKLKQLKSAQETGQTTGSGNKELLEEEKIITTEMIQLLDNITMDAYQSHMNEILENNASNGYDEYHLSQKMKNLSSKDKMNHKGKSPLKKGKTKKGNGFYDENDVDNDEDDEEFRERMKIGIMNAFEKSKQNYENQQRNSQLLAKDHLKNRLDQRKSGRNTVGSNETAVAIDDVVEGVMENFMDHFLESPVKPVTTNNNSNNNGQQTTTTTNVIEVAPKKEIILEEPTTLISPNKKWKEPLPPISPAKDNKNDDRDRQRITREMVESKEEFKENLQTQQDPSYNSYVGLKKDFRSPPDDSADENRNRIKAMHQEKEKELMDNLYSNMLEKKKKLEDRIRKKRESAQQSSSHHVQDSKDQYEEDQESHVIDEGIEKEKELLDQMSAIEKAYEIMCHAQGSNGWMNDANSASSNNNDQNALAKLISMMESIIQKTNSNTNSNPPMDSNHHSRPGTSSFLASESASVKQTDIPLHTVSRDAFVGEAKRISTAYTEEQTKLDLMMKIQQTRQRQALQRKLWERNQAKQQQLIQQEQQLKQLQKQNQRRPYHEGDDDNNVLEDYEDDDDDDPHDLLGGGKGIVINPQKSLLSSSRPSFHQDSVRGLLAVPTIAESRDQQKNMALRGLNLAPMKRK